MISFMGLLQLDIKRTEKMRIFFTQRSCPLKPALLITLLSFLPYQATSSNYYWDTASYYAEGFQSILSTTGEALSDITHQVKYTFVPVSPDHFPELNLGQLLTTLKDTSLEEANASTVCQDLHFKYMKDEYPGLLSFSAIDFGTLLGETRYSLTSSKTLHAFLLTFVPEADLTKSFLLLRPEMLPIITVGNDEEKWKKSCLYEYVLSNPPTGTEYKRVYIRLTAWRKRLS